MQKYYSTLLPRAVLALPKLFRFGSYVIYFWSNENNEPIHVHVCIGTPTANATKIWLTREGGTVIANNGSNIPAHELSKIRRVIAAQTFIIREKWKQCFNVDTVKYYC